MTITLDALIGVAATICAQLPLVFAVALAVMTVPVDAAGLCPTVATRAPEDALHSPILLEPEIREYPARYLPHFVLRRRVDVWKFGIVHELLN